LKILSQSYLEWLQYKTANHHCTRCTELEIENSEEGNDRQKRSFEAVPKNSQRWGWDYVGQQTYGISWTLDLSEKLMHFVVPCDVF